MYETLGQRIRAAREQLGLEQGELASALGLGQQAVSSWETGKSRPRRAMIQALATELRISVDLLLQAGGYHEDANERPRPPSRPLTRALPLDELSAERFEDLMAEILSCLHPEGHTSRFGGPGEKQFGIDLIVKADEGNAATGQCKRQKEFGPAAVKAAVREVTIKAKRNYLFLSRLTATPGARKEMAKYANWELWDGEDISRYIRSSMSQDLSIRLVDAYFPGHRESFLGVALPAPWLPVEEAFPSRKAQIFNHDWTLVGREAEILELASVAFGTERALAVLVGRGGLGKTRLLKAVAESAPNTQTHVRVLTAGTPVGPGDFELLPKRSLVVLIDDAHEREDIAYLLSGIWRQSANARIVLAVRPYGWEPVRTALQRACLLPDSPTSIELKDLDLNAAEALARQALEGPSEAVARKLARLTLDCPLATVVGGALIQRGKLDPGRLEHDPNVREAILRGFRDALVADASAGDRDVRAAVLDGIAALQPFRSNDDAFRVALSALVGRPFHELSRHLRSLEDAGILRRREASLRIVPDLLGDVVFAQACRDEASNADTGYLDRVREVASGVVLEQLYVNVSRVDWQVRNRNSSAPSLVDSLWDLIMRQIQEADIIGRAESARLLAKVAYFQPQRALRAARWLIDNPTAELSTEHKIFALFGPPSYDEVMFALAPIIKNAAYTFDSLPPALEQLWELAQRDVRPTNQFPEHPLRVLRDLAEFESGKPLEYNEKVLDVASHWFDASYAVSPFRVLEPLLATEGSSQTYRDFSITFQPYALNIKAVMPLRQRVIDLAISEAKTTDLRRATTAVLTLEGALRYPTGMYGRPVTLEESTRWTAGFVTTIEALGEVVAGNPDPVVAIAIRKAVNWHANYASGDTRAAARQLLDRLPDSLADRVALLLHDGWGHLLRDRDDDFQETERKREARLARAVAELNTRDDAEIITLLCERLVAERTAFGTGSDSGNPGPLVEALTTARPSLAELLASAILAGEAPGAEALLPIALAGYIDHDPASGLACVREILSTGSSQFIPDAAQAIGWNRGARPLAAGERDLVLLLAKNADPLVRRQAAIVAQRVAKSSPADAGMIVGAIDFVDSGDLAGEVFTCFSEQHYGLRWDTLSASSRAAIRTRLVLVTELDDYWVTHFLSEQSAKDPDWVVQLLQERVVHAEGLASLGAYRPMPFNWDTQLQVRHTAAFIPMLRQLHAWIAERPDSWMRHEMGAEVFQEVAVTYDAEVLQVLGVGLASTHESDVLAVAAVLRKAQRTLIWDAPEFVATALHAARRFGEDCAQTMAGALWSATITGSRVGTPGQPFQEDLEQRDRSKKLAAMFPEGSIEEQFYRDMASSAERSIARSAQEDLPSDGRDW
jgi:transcriptional regulator with XRE-family HTH domain